jgi:hypothetical protein
MDFFIVALPLAEDDGGGFSILRAITMANLCAPQQFYDFLGVCCRRATL